jgi:prophage regulatory protein
MRPQFANTETSFGTSMNQLENTRSTGPLPAGGLSRWKTIEPFIPFSRETYRVKAIAGVVPKPIRLGGRMTVFCNDEINSWLANPNSNGSNK